MKHKNFLKKLTAGILGFVMTLGVGAAGYAANASESKAAASLTGKVVYSGDIIKTTTDSSYGSTKATISSTTSGSNLTSATWSVNLGNNSTYMGSNSKQKAKLILSNGSISGYEAIATALGVQASATYYGLCLGSTEMENVGKITITASSTSVSNLYILYSTDNWSTATKLYDTTTPSSVDYTFDSTIAKARYAFVIKVTSFTGGFKSMTTTFYEGGSAPAPEADTYTVKFNGNGSTDSMDDVKVDITQSYQIPECEFTKSGYRFTGWLGSDSQPYAVGATLTAGRFNKDDEFTLTAQWEELPPYVIYNPSSSTAVTLGGGSAPTGASVTFKNTYTANKEQITSGNSQTLTLNGWSGYVIKQIVLGMHSNASAGAGYLSVKAGSTTIESFGSSSSGKKFNTWYDNTRMETDYRDVNVTLTKDDYVIGSGENVVIVIGCTTNSLFCNKFEIYYEEGVVETLQSISVTKQPTTKQYNTGDTFSTTGMEVTAHYTDSKGGSRDEVVTDYTVSPQTMAATTTSVTVSYGGKTTSVTGINVTSYKGIEYVNNTKDEFKAGDTFDYDGTLRQVYGHSSKADTYVEITSGYKFYVGQTEYTKSTVLEYGTYGVVVKWNNETTSSYSISVDYADPTGISMPSTKDLGKGDSLNLSLETTVLPAGYAEKAISWSIKVTEGELTTANYSFDETYGIVTINSENTLFGELTVTATCTKDTSISKDCVITVLGETAPVVIGVVVQGTSTAGTQYVHKPLDMSGLTVVGIRDKDGNIEIPSDSPAIAYNPLVVGEHPTGKYTDPVTGNEFNFTIIQITPVADSLASIAFASSAALSKTSYIVGEDWDSTGLSIVGTMASGDPAASSKLTGVTYTFNPTKPAVNTTSVEVTASLSGVSDVKKSFTVSVVDAQLESIEYISGPTTSEYVLGEAFNPAGLVVRGHYNLSKLDHDLKSDEYTLSEPDMYTLSPVGGTVVTVTSTENVLKTCQFTINVDKKTVTPGGTTWNQVNNVSELKAGDVYTFGCAKNGRVALPIPDGKTFFATSESEANATFNNGVLTPNSGVNPVELTLGGSTGAWTFTDSIGIVGATAAKSVKHGEGTTTWTVSISDGVASITSTQTSYGTIKYNSSSPRFLNYASGQVDIELYHKVTTAPIAADLIRIEGAVCNVEGIIPVGTTLTKSDFTVTGLFNDGTTKTLTESQFTATGLTLNNVGDNVVTISGTNLNSVEVHVTAVQATKYEFKLMNGSSQYGETIQAIEGQTIDLPTLTEDGKTFNGWSDGTATYTSSYSMPAHDITLNADWTVNHYTVTYSANGGTGTAPTDSRSGTYVYNDDVTILSAEGLSKQYCTFGGWSDGNGHIYKAGDTFKITENVTLTADWSYIDVEITFDKNGGTGNNPQKVTMHQGSDYSNVKNPNDDFKAGHPFGTHFAGWNTQADGLGTHYDVGSTISCIMSNLKLYAEWKVDDFPSTDLDATLVCSELGLENGDDGSGDFAIGTIATATFSEGSTYYTTGPGIRVYAGKTFTVTSKSGNISKIEIVYGAGTDSNAVTADSGTLSDGYTVWTPGEESTGKVVFTVGGTSKNRRIKSIKVYIAGSGQDVPEDATTVENLPGVGTENPIVLNDGTTVTGLIHEHGVLFEGESVSFTAEHGKVITYASVYMLYNMGYDLEYSNDYGATWTYNPFAKVTRATRAGETEIQDLKDTNAVRFTLNDPDSEAEKDILKSFKVTTSFGTNSNMSVDYDWTKTGNTYDITITKAYARFAIDVDEDFNKYFTEKDQYGGDYWIGFAYSTTGGDVIVDDHLAESGVSFAQYTKGEMPANNEFGLKLNCKSNLKQDKTVALIVKDSEGNLVEFSKQKTASFEDVFYAYFSDEVIAGLNAEELAVYNTLLDMLSK